MKHKFYHSINFIVSYVECQKFMTKTGFIEIFSHTSMEDIKGDNNQVATILDASTGEIVFQALMKSFKLKEPYGRTFQ